MCQRPICCRLVGRGIQTTIEWQLTNGIAGWFAHAVSMGVRRRKLRLLLVFGSSLRSLSEDLSLVLVCRLRHFWGINYMRA